MDWRCRGGGRLGLYRGQKRGDANSDVVEGTTILGALQHDGKDTEELGYH
jgi:hypothetical protein